MRERSEQINPAAGKERETDKTRYFAEFAASNLSKMRILRKGGILGKEGDNTEWRNISEHCLAEAVGADILAEHLGADRQKVVAAALLHDWYKRREVESMKEAGGATGHHTALSEDEKLLAEYGVSEDIINLTHSNIPKSADPDVLAGRTLEEKILHFADLMTLGSRFVDTQTRLNDARENPNVVAFSDSYRESYGGKSLIDVQAETGSQEQEEFERRLKLQHGSLLEFIQSKLDERIASQ